MRSFLVILAGMFLAFAPGMLRAQAEETIITESSDPVEDKYLDDVVRRTMVFENRVLPYEPLREADIPWQDIAFRTISMSLRHFFEDRRRGQFGFHVRDLPPLSAGHDAGQAGLTGHNSDHS